MAIASHALATDATLDEVAKDSTLDEVTKDATLQAVASILSSLKSINGKYGVVVLDSGDILISKTAQSSKTIKQVLTELETAVNATPLAFSASLISGTTDQYKISVTTGTPT